MRTSYRLYFSISIDLGRHDFDEWDQFLRKSTVEWKAREKVLIWQIRGVHAIALVETAVGAV